MNLNNGEFETSINGELEYCISITRESNLSIDGGHSFEEVTNAYELNKQAARLLLNELKLYLGDV